MFSLPLWLCICLYVIVMVVQAADTSNNNADDDSLKCARITQRTTCGSHVCNTTTHTCSPCHQDTECDSHVLSCVNGRCEVRSLGSSISGGTIFAAVIAFFVCALAVVAGIGGGGILVPLFIAVVGFPPALAVGMSQSTILGQSLLNTIVVSRRRHPIHPRPIVNYDALLILLPMTLAGTTLGHILGRVVPDWLRMLFLFTLLGYILKRTLEKAKSFKTKSTQSSLLSQDVTKQRQDENNNQELRDIVDTQADDNDTRLPSIARTEETDPNYIRDDDHMPSPPPGPYIHDAQYPKFQMGFCFALWIFLGVCSLLKSPHLGIATCGSSQYWVIVVVIIVVNIICAAGLSRYFRRQQRAYLQIESASMDELPPGDVRWTTRNAVYFPAFSVLAGIGASVLGIGGGMVLGVILLEMEMHTDAVSATSGVSTFFAASMAASQFALGGELPIDYGIMFFVVGVCSTVLGQFGIAAYIRKHQLNHWVVYSLAAITLGSIVSLGIIGTIGVAETITLHGSFGFGDMCRE
eukprot:PhF_6_TR35389/c0_g1_i1/m.51452